MTFTQRLEHEWKQQREGSTKSEKLGIISPENKGLDVEEQVDGVVGWLVYIIIMLVSGLFTLWNKLMGNRLKAAEETADDAHTLIHDVKDELIDKISERDAQLYEKMESRRLETKKDLQRIESKVETGHSQILSELRKNNGGA